jgi:hypothetical protein
LPNARPFEIGDLRKHSYDDLTHTPRNGADPSHFNPNTLFKQAANGRLHIESIATDPVERKNVKLIAFAHVVEQFCEPWPLRSDGRTADLLIDELTVEPAT